MKDFVTILELIRKINDISKLNDSLDEYAKFLIIKKANNADLSYKEAIRDIDNFKNLVEYHFQNRFKILLKGEDTIVDELLSVKDVSKRLKTSELSVRNYINKGYIKATYFGDGRRKQIRVKESDLEKYLRK